MKTRSAWLLVVLGLVGCRQTGPMQVDDQPLRVSVDALTLPPAYVDGGRSEATFTLSNPGRTGKHLALVTERPFAAPSSLELPGGDEVTVRVTFTPEHPGPASGLLTVLDGERSVEISLQSEGLEWLHCNAPATCAAVRFDPEQGQCVETVLADGEDCKASSPCLVAATCQGGRCVGTANSCDDGDACTVDACSPSGCVKAPVICQQTEDSCFVAECDPAVGCRNVPVADGIGCGPTDCVWARICVSGACVKRRAPTTPACTDWELEAYLKSTNTGVGDSFGASLSLSADGAFLAVGAPQEDSIDALHPMDDGFIGSGAVYVFRRSGSLWTPVAFLKADNADTEDHFGTSVSFSSDGSVLLVGADGEDSAATGVNGNGNSNGVQRSGAAYVFRKNGSQWTQVAYLKASNTGAQDAFGSAVALSDDGLTALVGAPGEASIGAPNDNSGPGAGAAYLFRDTAGTWSPVAMVKASVPQARAGFGAAVAMNAAGTRIAIGAPLDDAAAVDSGSVTIFDEVTGTFVRTETLLPMAPAGRERFGASLSCSGDGEVLAVGAPGASLAAGEVAVFTHASVWSAPALIRAAAPNAQDGFGVVALSRDGLTLVVGAPGEDSSGDPIDDSETDSGAATVFRLVGASWVQQRYLKALEHDAGDLFGGAVSLSADGTGLVVGAVAERSSATGVDGDASNDTADYAGAVYAF